MVFIGNILTLLLTITVVVILIVIEFQHSIILASIYVILLLAIIFNQYQNIRLQQETNKQRASKHLTFDIIDNLPIGVIAYNQFANITFINESCQKLLGVSHVDVVNKNISELQHLTSVVILNNIAHFVLDSGKIVYDQRLSLVGNLGQEVECRVYAYPLVGQREEPGLICILSDITIELNYNNLKRISDTILRDMEGAVVAVNSNLVITMYNQTAEKIFKASADEIIGKSIDELIMYSGYQDLTICKAIVNKRRVTEEKLVTIGGKKVYLYNKADVLLDDEQNVVGAICVFHDISEVKIKHELMLKQEKLATIGQMAAGIAHELRNPLTSVRGFAQLLSEKTTPQNQQMFTIMLSELDRMEQLVQDFLQLSRPKEPELKKICLNQVITKLYSLTKSQCHNKNINIITNLAPDLPLVLADDSQLTQVVLNLIRNAIEAVSEQKQGNITIQTSLAKGRQGVCIKVIDNGQGIAPENLAKIGMPFFTTKGHGTGLGLAICYNIIKQHGGTLQVDSRLDEGTCFKIYLPIKITN